ncbi:anthrone oxygenase family protein [Burkholderia ubonensis]|uniref:anthrone oxygenase family protein n=1 Tax=Burkholderia ubonensis TaxID=101571 RepID=UPI000AAD0B2D|nr:anthrone oxygenase family protein [Burkholderia ubonensis]
MRAVVTLVLLWFSAIGCGLMAGVYFAFSTFVMTSLGRLAPAAGVAAMNAINVDIVRSLFMPVFLGTTLASLALAILALLNRSEPGAIWIVAGGAIYVLGMFVVTMAFNVPLNDALAATDASSAEGRSGHATCATGRSGITRARWRRRRRAACSSPRSRRGSAAA